MLQHASSIEKRMLRFCLHTSQVLGIASGWVMLRYSRKINNEGVRRHQKITTQLYEIQQQHNFTILIGYSLKWLYAAFRQSAGMCYIHKGINLYNESKTKPEKQQVRSNQGFVCNKDWFELWEIQSTSEITSHLFGNWNIYILFLYKKLVE